MTSELPVACRTRGAVQHPVPARASRMGAQACPTKSVEKPAAKPAPQHRSSGRRPARASSQTLCCHPNRDRLQQRLGHAHCTGSSNAIPHILVSKIVSHCPPAPPVQHPDDELHQEVGKSTQCALASQGPCSSRALPQHPLRENRHPGRRCSLPCTPNVAPEIRPNARRD